MGRLVRSGPSWPERMGGAAQPETLTGVRVGALARTHTHTHTCNFKKLGFIHAYKLEYFNTQYSPRNILLNCQINTKEYKAHKMTNYPLKDFRSC